MDTSYQRTTASDEWYTPREIVDALGRFELDPCAPEKPLYQTADVMIDKNQDGLKYPWGGGAAFGATHRTASPLLHSLYSVWQTIITAYYCYLPGWIINCSRTLYYRVPRPFCLCATAYGFTGRTARRAAALVSEARL